MRRYLQKLDAEKPVILCGDLNVAHEDIDLKNPGPNRGAAGFSDQERGKLDELLATISETLDFEAEVATKRLVTLLEPIMIVIMGIIVAFVVVAVILPIYQSYGTIGASSGAI